MLLPDIKANLSLEPIAHKISIFDKLHLRTFKPQGMMMALN